MRDRVAEVLAERRTLQRGPGAGLVISLALHGALAGVLVFSAVNAKAPVPASMVQIQFASATQAPTPAAPRAPATRPAEVAPPAALEQPKPVPKIEEPKPVVEPPTTTPEKNTVPLSPFGQSTKKGSETPAPAAATPSLPAPAPPATGAPAIDIPIGGSGVTGLEGGDFPYALYITGMQRRIGANWVRPQITPGASAVVYFRILRNGTIDEADVTRSSGNQTFDRAALSAVLSSNKLNPLPPGYSGNWLGVHLTFR